MANLIKQVQNTVFQNEIFKRGDKIILGVSGGPDSCALLDIFSKLQKKSNLSLLIAHVNYGLRGKDSDRDEQFVGGLAKKYGLPIEVLHPKYRENKNTSESHLRDIRYAFFEKVRAKHDFDLIAVAHNADDQAETVLMRLIRGTGLAGLAAMRAKNGNIIRPLLSTTRKEITNYLEANRLKYRIDKTNRESVYLRNRIRNKLIPYLEKNFNPQIRPLLAKSARAFGEDYAVIEDLAEKTWRKNQELEIKKILRLPTAIQKRVLQKALGQKTGKDGHRQFRSSEEFLKALRSSKSKRQTISGTGLKMSKRGGKITLE